VTTDAIGCRETVFGVNRAQFPTRGWYEGENGLLVPVCSRRELAAALDRGLTNTLFFNEVDSREMPGLLAQRHVGLLALDPRHKTHNITGKFLTYLLAGLPVLARVNAGTDLAYLIENEDVGRVYVGNHVDSLSQHAEELADWPLTRDRMATKGRALGARMFSPETAVRQIIAASGLGVSPLNCG